MKMRRGKIALRVVEGHSERPLGGADTEEGEHRPVRSGRREGKKEKPAHEIQWSV
jgi:hypothetical protein